MKLIFSAALIAALTIASGLHAEASLPVYGTWDCEEMLFALDADTYVISTQDTEIKIKVKSIRNMGENAYHVVLTDGYEFSLGGVTTKSLTWMSGFSDDIYDCKRMSS